MSISTKTLPSAAMSAVMTASALCLLNLLIAPAAHADARVDRDFGMTRPQQTKPASPLSLFPANGRKPVETASKPSIPADVDNDQHGAYSVDTVSPTMYSKNIVYVTPFPVPPHPNTRVTINSVLWKFSTRTQPSGFEAALCWKDNKTCVNISRYASGQSLDFNGRDAWQPFFLQFQVAGTGTLPQPVVGETAQLIVNYRVWPQ